MMKIVKIKTGEYGERPLSRVRLFVHKQRESMREDLLNRFNRPSRIYRKEVLPKVFKKLKLEPSQVRWSQRAGCPCGCSPGFILDNNPAQVGYEAIWVTIK